MITCLRLYFATWCMMAHWKSRCARSLCAKVSKTNICAKLPLILRKKYGHFVETLLLIGVFHDTIPFFSYFIKEASGLLVSNSSQKNPVLTKEKNFSWFEFYFCKVFIFYLIFMKNKFWLWKYSKFQPKKNPVLILSFYQLYS